MNIGIFTRGVKSHSWPYESAFATGLLSSGHSVSYHKWGAKPDNIDLAVTWGMNNKESIQYFKDNGIDFVVLERGYIGDRHLYTSCGFNGLNGKADFCLENVHWKDRRHMVDKYVKPVRKTDGAYVLIIGQVPTDASVRDIGFNKWLDEEYERQLELTDLPIYFRPHPLDKDPYVPQGLEILIESLEYSLDNAAYVVTLNSNVGVDAVLRGVPCIARDEGSMVYGIAQDEDIPLVVYELIRESWLTEMSYTQWTIEEMESGKTWEHLRGRYGSGD